MPDIIRDLDLVNEPLASFVLRLQGKYRRVYPDRRLKVLETVRTKERQETLYEQGRTAPGTKVTWTKISRHFPDASGKGNAVDLGVEVYFEGKWHYINGDTQEELVLYEDIGKVMHSLEGHEKIQHGVTLKGKLTDLGHLEIKKLTV